MLVGGGWPGQGRRSLRDGTPDPVVRAGKPVTLKDSISVRGWLVMGGTGVTRFVAAGAAGLVAVLYLLIGFDVITVVQDQAEAGAAPVLIAGVLFAALAVLLAVTASRRVLVAGAVLQVVVLVMYLVVATERVPAFEAWGLAIKALQVGLLAGFVAMLVRRRRSQHRRAGAPA
jgi:hypothetical protein